MAKKKSYKTDMRIIKTHLKLYKSDHILLIGPYEKIEVWAKEAMIPYKFEKFKKELGSPEKSLQGRTWDLGGGGSVVWMPKWNRSVFVHELTHMVLNLFEAKNTPINRDTEELYAYAMEYLYEQLRADY